MCVNVTYVEERGVEEKGKGGRGGEGDDVADVRTVTREYDICKQVLLGDNLPLKGREDRFVEKHFCKLLASCAPQFKRGVWADDDKISFPRLHTVRIVPLFTIHSPFLITRCTPRLPAAQMPHSMQVGAVGQCQRGRVEFYMYIHTYIHTYVHTYIHKCTYSYIHTCMYASIHACAYS